MGDGLQVIAPDPTASAEAAQLDAITGPVPGSYVPEDDLEPGQSAAPVAGNLDPDEGQAPDGGQPAGQPATPEPSLDAESGQRPAPDPDGQQPAPAGEPEVLDAALIQDLLGVTQTTPASLEEINRRYEASSREAHELVQKTKAYDMALAAAHVQVVRKADGTMGLAPLESYYDELKPESLPDVFNTLKDDEKNLFLTDEQEACRVVARKVMAAMGPQRPPVDATAQDQVIAPLEVETCFQDLVNARLGDGKTPRYAGADKPETQQYMRQIYDDPGSESFRNWMNGSKQNFSFGLAMLHGKVAHALGPRLAQQADAQYQHKQRTKAGASLQGDQVGGSSSGVKSAVDLEMDRIANATPM